MFQAVLIGLIYGLSGIGALYGFMCGLGFSTLTWALLVGLVMGDVPGAMVIGASLQLMYLGIIAPGGNAPQDPTVATLVSTTLVLATGAPLETAVALAIPLGLLGAQLLILIRTVNIVWVHMADRYAAKGNIKGIYLAGLLYPTLFKLPLRWIPVTLATYFGPTYIELLLDMMPEAVINGLTVVGGMMPAVGFAMVVSVIGRRNLLPFFAAGFFFIIYSGITTMALAIAGLILAYLTIMFTNRNKSEVA
ncbi:MAG: PTS sugar transporter subunit IIC [Clostridiales Family XIII bacterium]|nr:PTS sugar transporter subunit IIC [Clostridiales Family XIII bacterium]